MNYADKEQMFQSVLAEKERIIKRLQADNKMYKAELNGVKDFIQQLKQEQTSVNQKIDDSNKEMMEKLRLKDEMLAKLKEESTEKQQSFDVAISKHTSQLKEM